MTYLRFDLTLRSPAIVSTLSGDPNSSATQRFIPGGAIRGAVAARLIAAGEDPEGELFRRLVLSGEVRYLHAYPKIGGARSLPTSLSWRSPKDDPNVASDLASFAGAVTEETDAEDFGDMWPESSLVSAGGDFVSAFVAGGARTLDSVRVGARVHQQRDRVKGRPWKDGQENPHGAIFAYEYLEGGQTFTGTLHVTDAAAGDLDRIKELLSEPILVGRSRRSGYGGDATISEFGETTREFAGASGLLSEGVSVDQLFRVLLTSAYIGRHPLTGQNDPQALEHELIETFGGAVTVERRRWAFETVGGFNRKWALETPQVLTVREGSVLVLRATQDITSDTLIAVENRGFGERCVEGFGRVVFLTHSDDHEPMRLRTDDDSPQRSAGAVAAPQNPHLTFLESRLVLNAARAELDRVARLDLVNRATNLPTNSLLGRLRTPLRAALDDQTARQCLQTLATWCGNGNNALKANARDKLVGCKLQVGGAQKQSLLDWLKDVASVRNGQAGWQTLLAGTGNQASVTALATRHHVTSVEAAQAVLDANAAALRVHLIDAVLAAMARKNRRGEG